jgi:hypothetical protein
MQQQQKVEFVFSIVTHNHTLDNCRMKFGLGMSSYRLLSYNVLQLSYLIAISAGLKLSNVALTFVQALQFASEYFPKFYIIK